MRKKVIIKIRSQFHEIERERDEAVRFITEMRSFAADGGDISEDGFDGLLRELFGDEDETMEMCTEGELVSEGGRIEVKYTEPEPTGMGETVTSISFDTSDRGLIAIMRGGEIYTALILERGVRHSCVYSTAYMPITICTTAKKVENSISEDGGELLLVYTVEGGMGVEQYNKMQISVTLLD